jgi:hypothetical protein
MHPEILRELAVQRNGELRERAHRAQLARAVSRDRRFIRRSARHPDEADAFVVPAIPDYADGSFRTAADQAVSPVPAARRAA